MIAIISDKQDKVLSRKLASYLESQNYSVWELWRDRGNTDPSLAIKNILDSCSLAIFIMNKTSFDNALIFNAYKSFFRASKPIILFLNAEIEESLANWYFLETHDYVKAYDTSFDKATQSLTVLLEDYLKNTSEHIENKAAEAKTANKQQKSRLYAVLAVLVVLIVGYFLIKNSDKQANPGQQKQTQTVTTLPPFSPNKIQNSLPQYAEQDIIGTWKLVDYRDNIPRSGKDLADFNQVVNNLKKSFLLIFNDNHTFVRQGFTPKAETGYWHLDKQTHTLYLTQTKNGQGDGLKILTLNKNQFIFEVASYEKQYGTVIVRFTLQKVQ